MASKESGEKPVAQEEAGNVSVDVDEKIVSDGDAQSSTAGLNEQEKAIIDKQTDAPNEKVGYFALFRYADKKDALVILVATIASIAAGAAMPLMILVFGNFAGSFTGFSVDAVAAEKFQDQINTYTLYFVYIGIGSFVSVYIGMVGFSYTGERITQQIRELYLQAIFRQNIAFFDFLGSGEITTRISSDMVLVHDGIGQKISLFISGVSMFIAALLVGFIRGWKLTLIMLSATVALVLIMAANGGMMRINQTKAVDEFATAGTLAEEVISSSRNVTAYGTQKRLQKKYQAYLTRGAKWDFKSKFWLSSMMAGIMAVINLQYSLAFWQGDRFLKAGELGVANILTVVMAAMIAGISIGSNLPHLQAFGEAVAAATKVFNTIERESPIDPETKEGDKPAEFIGNIEFKDIKHIYPSRPETVVVENFNLTIEPGKMVALVGASGSGKSTIFGLLERFYLPMAGQVFLDGRDTSTLNLRWLRRQMALVSQEPILFSITIYESIAHGLVGTEYENAADNVKKDLIEEAAKTANAYDFIMDLPNKFDTRVGERGNLLSGGQKQRIAIARAVVSDPKILLLDEATAALDTKSEKVVQEALDKASKGRTTIAIAHRLSTIRNADKIVVMAKGKVVEQGTHDELMAAQSIYESLVQAQELTSKIQPNNRNSEISLGENEVAADGDHLSLSRTATTREATVAAMKKDAKNEEYSNWDLIKFSWELNRGEHGQMMIGFFFCTCAGAGPAIQAIFFGNSINSFFSPQTSTGGHNINFWCWMFFMLGLATYIFYFGQGFTLAKASSQLLARVRAEAFSAILRQDIEFFDSDTVTSGALATFLSSEANRLAGLSGSTLGTIVTAIATIIISIIVGVAFGWKLALVCTSTIPLMIGCGYFRFYTLIRMEKQTKKSTDAASFACEAASSIRTVASLSLEKHLLNEYHDKLTQQAKGNLKFMNVSAVLYGVSQGLSMFILALVFWYGGRLMLSTEYTVLQFFIVYSAIINGAQNAGTVFSFAPDMGEARDAAVVLKSFLNRVPKIDHWSTEGKQVDRLVGKIEIQNVRFNYPGRADHRVLRGVNITAEPGQFVALVGASGSGKSTIMALLERFYDPTEGSVMVDGVELKEYNLQSYRAQLAIVSQETTLYTGTIRDNILADKDDVSDEVVVQACKDANIYEFIVSLPDGFNTLVGAKGALLSGGQRQRLAIARALLRDPKILLLDEATSALDSTSERVVQSALDAAAQGRTTIAIAHRLSTIQHADLIYVFDQGKVVEKGRHDELMGRKGVYWELARLQSMGAPQ
ncbi:P-loop containing nucleoside triphosphate hydrolase protein [Byssothecium circinans]|uniref:P-loop containing nucleoside triphosphate hydrolase protein n=1 Tax=Byssothecium circinans TaxID=147558 RepID=A0A6A5TGP9_9PLEO|nr:P-loop containing nucleoside triphosphate hydrolase protein [Byssothecium circinans]